jgi:hypothetical protein
MELVPNAQELKDLLRERCAVADGNFAVLLMLSVVLGWWQRLMGCKISSRKVSVTD